MLAGFIPEQWPASNRNSWPTSVGIIRSSPPPPIPLHRADRHQPIAVSAPTMSTACSDFR